MLLWSGKVTVFLAVLLLGCSFVRGQDITHGQGFQTAVMDNPAFAGSNGESMLRLSYLNLLPGHSYNLHSVYLSYDSYFPVLHGGAGFYLTNDYLGGIINDLRGGFSYSYFLQAGRDFFVNAGLTASFINRGYSFGEAILPDMIDNLGGVTQPSSELLADKRRTVMDIGAGVLLIWNKMFAGFSVLHLTGPDLSGSGSSADKLRRRYSLSVTGELKGNKRSHLKMRPAARLDLQGNYFSISAGSALESNYLSVNILFLSDNNRNLDMQTGFSVSSGRLTFLYNYRFNIASRNPMAPFSLVHQTGLAFSLNNVEKRIRVKTINIPEM